MKRLVVALGALAVVAAAPPASAQPATHLLVIVGLGGDVETAARFHEWAAALVDAARGPAGISRESAIYLAEDVAGDPGRIDGRSTREGIAQAVDRLASRARPGDRVVIVLVGHGASASGEPRFNLPGPDLTAAQFARLLDHLRAQTVAFINTASASGSFIAPLAGRDRVVITATKGEGERNQTRFPGFFVEALTSAEADLDKDGRVSLLEAFTWARQRTVASYEQDGQVLTEHAQLDDDGDGKGSQEPGAGASDGAVARTIFVSAGERSDPSPGADVALRALYDERRQIEGQVAALKASRDGLDAARYQQELERLLLELARKTREIREREKK